MRVKLLGLASVVLLVATASACVNTASQPNGSSSSQSGVRVVAAENFYGDVARQLGGDHILLTTILSDPNADPHEYESTVQDSIAVSKAQVVIENGLGYDTWMANGVMVSEVKRFTVDAGHNLDQLDSTFTVVAGAAKELTVAIGLNKNSADRGQEAKFEDTRVAADSSAAQWITQKTNGMLGTAIIVPGSTGFAEDNLNHLVLAKATSGKPLRYYVGAGWSKAGEFTTKEAWNAYVATCAARAKSPVKITLSSP